MRANEKPTRVMGGSGRTPLRFMPRGVHPILHGVLASLTVLSAVVCCVLVGHAVARRIVREASERELVDAARIVAGRVDWEAHERLFAPEHRLDPTYEQVARPLREMTVAIPDLAFAYTMRETPEGLRFVVEVSAQDDSGSASNDAAVKPSSIGALHPDPDAAMLDAFRTGNPAVSPEPKIEERGTFVSAFAPVRDNRGRVVCIVGVDITAERHLARLARVDHAALLALLPGLIASLGIGVGVAGVQAKRREQQRTLLSQHALLQEMERSAKVGGWSLDADTRAVHWTDQTRRIHEVPQEFDQSLESAVRFYAPESQPVIAAAVERSLVDGTPYDLELRFITAKGRHRWVRAVGAAEWSGGAPGSGRVQRLYGSFQDITEHKEAELAAQAVSADARRLAAAIDAAADAVFLTDANGHITRVNAAFARLTGYAPEEVIGRLPSLLKSERTPTEFYDNLWSTITAGRVWSGRLLNRRAGSVGGSEYWVDSTITPLFGADGAIEGFVAVQRDVTALVASEEEERIRLACAETRLRAASVLAERRPLHERIDAVRTVIASLPGISEGVDRDAVVVRLGPAAPRDDESIDWHVSLIDRRGDRSDDRSRELGIIGLALVESAPSPHAIVLASIRDIAELLVTSILQDRAAALAEEARRRAEEANAMKSDFLANMSHEIRTPMTAILGFADLLHEDGDRSIAPRQRLEYIRTIRRNGEHLLALINDILDLSKIEAGRMTVERIAVDPEQVIADVGSLMRVKAREGGIELEILRETELPARVRSDPVRLKQILINLVGNAIKFTPQGRVTLRVAACADATGAPRLRFRVEDTGIGIAPEQLPRLFGAFTQADGSTTRRFGGTGLGLRISRTFAQLLGGDIEVESELGRGSIFTATVSAELVEGGESALPTARTLMPRPLAPPDGAEASLVGARIWVAEDGPDNQRLIALHLRRAGAEVTLFENGRLALEAFTSDGTVDGELRADPACDLLLSDMQMPELDGYGLVHALRQRGWRGPIVALTANAMIGDSERCLVAGCDAYATKPIDRATLIATVAAHLPPIERRAAA
jgi:PAS domain S-box-containing protein